MADKQSYIDNAQKFLQKNQLDKAIREYYKALEADPRDVRVRHKLGELLARYGMRPEALKELDLVAEAYSKEGFYLKAVAVYKQMIKLKEDLFEIHLKLGSLYKQLSLVSDALEHYRLVAAFYEQNGTSKECIEVFQKLVDLTPEDLVNRTKLAEFYARDERLDEAFNLFQAIAKVHRERNRLDELVKVYERMLQLRPGELSLYKDSARLLLEVGDARKALARLQVCFKVEPNDPEILSLLGETFQTLDQGPKARSVFRELVRIYDYQGLSDKVKETWERIRRLDPEDQEALDALGIKAPPRQPVMGKPIAAPASGGVGSGPSQAGSGASISLAQISISQDSVVVTKAAPATPAAAIPTGVPIASIRPVERVVPVPAAVPVASPVATPVVASIAKTVMPASAQATSSLGGSGARPASSPSVPLSSAPPGAVKNLREIPASISKLMTETEVYLKYQLTDKALTHLKLILEKEPSCYVVREKRRDVLAALGRRAEAAAESEKMAMLASGAGDQVQARIDLERAIQLEPDNMLYQHALAALSMMSRPAVAAAPPPFFSPSLASQVEIEVVEDEDEEEDDRSIELTGGAYFEDVDLVDDGTALDDIFNVDVMVDESQLLASSVPAAPAALAGPGASTVKPSVALSSPSALAQPSFQALDEELVDDGDAIASLFLSLGEDELGLTGGGEAEAVQDDPLMNFPPLEVVVPVVPPQPPVKPATGPVVALPPVTERKPAATPSREPVAAVAPAVVVPAVVAPAVVVSPPNAAMPSAVSSSGSVAKSAPPSAAMPSAVSSSGAVAKSAPTSGGVPKAPPTSGGVPKAPPTSGGVPKAPPTSGGVPKAPPTGVEPSVVKSSSASEKADVGGPSIDLPEDLVFDLFGDDFGGGPQATTDDAVDDDSDGAIDFADELKAELMDTRERPAPVATDPTRRALEVARAYMQMGLLDAALKELERCREQGPLGIEAMRLLGQCHFKRGAYADAVYWCQTVLNRNDLTETQELESLFDLGQIYEAQQDFQRALDLYEEIAGLNQHFRKNEMQSRMDAVTRQLKKLKHGA